MNRFLDIHTHKELDAITGEAIFNYPLVGNDLYPLPLKAKTPNMYLSAGIHPWQLTEANADEQLDKLQQLLDDEQLVAVGEAGLDKLTEAPMTLQVAMLEKQVDYSEQYHLPLIVHCVKAIDELLKVKKRCAPQQPWIWHGFRGKSQQALQLLQHGFYLSFGEFYSEEAVSVVPVHRLFVETDESALPIDDILKRVALVRTAEVEALREQIAGNIQNVFFSK